MDLKNLLGKRVTLRFNPDFRLLCMGDSHLAGFAKFLEANGCNTISIHGGTTTHVKQAWDYVCGLGLDLFGFITMVGGNNLEGGDMPEDVKEGLASIVRSVAKASPNTTIATGSVIPRIPDKDRAYESGHRFLLGMEEVDLTMNKAAFRHHHFLTDLNVGEGESVLRLENYQKDGVHLNNKGVEAYKTVLTYVLDCMAFEVWRERKILPLPGSEKEFRTVMWKF